MSLIGKYDYCSNALLSNATWAEAICNSEYFEEVLNVKVPKMTSNTAPSGECSASSVNTISNHITYHAFDNNDSTFWSSANNGIPAWIKYKFPNKVCVRKAKIKPLIDGGTHCKDFVIQGSNNDSNWTDLYSGTNPNGSDADIVVNFTNSNKYQYYRCYMPNSYTRYCALTSLQFYGRASAQTNIIHSAANDTIYMMKDGSPLVLTTTDSNGVGTLDFTQFDDGVTYKLYSSVAKDPNNLSNDYSKDIRVTKNKYGCTTEAYLMPDGAIYWYGYSPYDSTITTYATINSTEASSGGYSGLAPTINRNVNNLESLLTGSAKGGAWIFNTLLPFTKYTNLKVITKDYTIGASSYAIPQTVANPPTAGYSGGKSIFNPASNTLFTVATSSLSNYIGVHLHTFNSALISFSALWLE